MTAHEAMSGRAVAILAPRGRDASVARDLLTGEGIAAFVVDSLEQLAAAVQDDLGAVLLTEESLAGPEEAALRKAVAAQPIWSDLPFIVLTNGGSGARTDATRARIDALGNAVLIARPLHADTLLRAARSALDARRRQFEARLRMDELHRREADLRESESKFHAITDFIDQMVWSTLPDGYHDYYNRRWYEFTGMPDGSTDGEAWNGVFHPEDQDRAWDSWRHSLETGDPYEIEYRLRHRSGEYRWVLGRAQPVRGEDGAILRWYGTCTDIHDEVLARDETLARSRAERDVLWNGARDLFAIIGADGVYRDVNPRWTDVLGYAPDELIGHHFDVVIHDEDVPRAHEKFAAVVADRPIFDLLLRIRRKDGGYLEVEWNAGKDGDSVFASGRDVTERMRRKAALVASEAALRQSQKLETIGQLTGGVAHDFNNLLMAIRSSLDLLGSRLDPDDGRAIALLDNARTAAMRGASLTQRMLAFARKQELDAAAVDVAVLLPGLKDLIARSIGPQIAIELQISPDVPPAFVDANQLEMAILNLAVNARDAMDGEGRLEIGLARTVVNEAEGAILSLKPGAYVRIDVTDTGAGMDTATLAQAMEPFFTTKGVGEGTGLGLSMVHGLAAQSGGTFRMDSTPGVGTTAKLYLPVAATPAAPATVPEPTPALTREPSAGARALTVLAVDDDVLVLMGTVGLLEDMGHAVIEASSAHEALNLFEAHPEIDLVVTDQAMPKMTGVELASNLRARRPGIAIILATGYSEMPEGAGGNVSTRLEKPFGPADLTRAIAEVM
ncbi:hybrid sensor histidine kinase/response regulator [Jannaschia donghaensis]|uniref:histidine kinase n=1 Tax=Jannaschia donghaensis TaxID=420998 RepID=A0A0M6YHS5_9RHOB|nr:hybrid sensor histidine kinase/response regulator [Jannaschia donghaensis]CTQ49474.1 Blue-light-activated protein [Jannaschia donghaensis]